MNWKIAALLILAGGLIYRATVRLVRWLCSAPCRDAGRAAGTMQSARDYLLATYGSKHLAPEHEQALNMLWRGQWFAVSRELETL